MSVSERRVPVQGIAGSDETTRARLREAVEGLADIERRATTRGERASAEWVAQHLREAGATDVRLVPYKAHSTWAVALVAHSIIVLTASVAGGLVARAVATLAAVSLEADATGRSFWLRRLLPGKGPGTSVQGRVAPPGKAHRTVVIVAHHDAAHNGWVWHARMVERSRRRAARTGITPSYWSSSLIAMLLIATAPVALVQRIGQAVLGVGISFAAQAAFSRTVPGANDNSSGVAGLLELARRLADKPIAGLDVILLCPGGEEAGAVGMASWLSQERANLDPATTLFIGLDSIGSGEPVVSVRESLSGRYRHEDIELVERAAARAGLPPPRRVGLGAISDPLIPRYRGFHSVSLLAWRDGMIANLHRPTDVPENVDYSSAERVTDLAYSVIVDWVQS